MLFSNRVFAPVLVYSWQSLLIYTHIVLIQDLYTFFNLLKKNFKQMHSCLKILKCFVNQVNGSWILALVKIFLLEEIQPLLVVLFLTIR